MKVEDMKVHYVVLVDGTELMCRTEGPNWFGRLRIWDACMMIIDEHMLAPPRIRKWMPWTETDDSPITLTPQSITTCFVVNEEMADWYEKSVESINQRTDEVLAELEKKKQKTADQYEQEIEDELAQLSEELPELEEFLQEFMTRKKETLH